MEWPENSLQGNEQNDQNESSDHVKTDPFIHRNLKCKDSVASDICLDQKSTKGQCDQSPMSRRGLCEMKTESWSWGRTKQ